MHALTLTHEVRNMTADDLVRLVDSDANATERERALVEAMTEQSEALAEYERIATEYAGDYAGAAELEGELQRAAGDSDQLSVLITIGEANHGTMDVETLKDWAQDMAQADAALIDFDMRADELRDTLQAQARLEALLEDYGIRDLSALEDVLQDAFDVEADHFGSPDPHQ